jgi:hypothetical protein
MNLGVNPSPLAGEERVGLAACCLATLGEGGEPSARARHGLATPHQLRVIRFAHKSRILSRKGRGIYGVAA